ncbi:IS3 family transposase, partial [Pseudomonas aeruginosa]
MLREEGVTIGRCRVRRLMPELGLATKKPGSNASKPATGDRPAIPNPLKHKVTT